MTSNGISSETCELSANFKDLPSVPAFKELPPIGIPFFDKGIRLIFKHEGLYSDDPDDPGGPTKYGISLRLARQLGDLDGDGYKDLDLDRDGDVDIHDIRLIKPIDAVKTYYGVFAAKYRYSEIPERIAIKTLDLAVNMGSPQAFKLLQRAVRACCPTVLNDDGVMGPKTVEAVNSIYQPNLLIALRSEAAGFYRQLIAVNPVNRKYQNGWLNRAYA